MFQARLESQAHNSNSQFSISCVQYNPTRLRSGGLQQLCHFDARCRNLRQIASPTLPAAVSPQLLVSPIAVSCSRRWVTGCSPAGDGMHTEHPAPNRAGTAAIRYSRGMRSDSWRRCRRLTPTCLAHRQGGLARRVGVRRADSDLRRARAPRAGRPGDAVRSESGDCPAEQHPEG